MRDVAATRAALLAHCARWPALQVQDLLKFLHQSAFGCGHLVDSGSGALEALRTEAALFPHRADVEPLDGPFARVHLGVVKDGLAVETLWRIFVLSSRETGGGAQALEEKLTALLSLAREGALPFSPEEVAGAADRWRRGGFPACHHSAAFRAAYAPAYRVVSRDFARILPLLSSIDRKMAAGRPIIVAIEGGSAAGKTTLGGMLQQIYGCSLFHMDDFFLRPAQRTAERLSQPGGNVDYERFYEEVLLPLRGGRAVSFRRYDCHSQQLLAPTTVAPAALSVVEGAYSAHPALRDHYDLTVFLEIDPGLQRRRIQRRNTPDFQQRFFHLWIPLERRYQEAFDIPGHCDLILEVKE